MWMLQNLHPVWINQLDMYCHFCMMLHVHKR
uniref:Uncharacterized protein n=1 Tax=Arundo donax TaxID=35708 RepID=A0A0A9A565_ARUDO